MIRAVFEESLLFLVPFAVFALYLAVRRRNPLHVASWSESTSWLLIAGLACVVASLVITGVTADRQKGAFVPPHLENGQVVPGQFR